MFAASFAAVALGVVRALLDTFETLARTKSPREIKQTLRDNAAVQCEVGLAEARIGAARSYLFESLRSAWEWVQRGEPIALAHRIRIRLASTYAIHEAREVAARIYHEAGATAIFESQPFERRLRDINTVSQQVQGRRAHFETGGQFFLGLAPVNAFL
jgi:alkylation response protein AidB-like acyl-CoA dehydrogenase